MREENKDKIKLVKEKIQMDKQTFREEGRKENLENGMMFSNYVSEARLSLKSKPKKKKKKPHTHKNRKLQTTLTWEITPQILNETLQIK